MKENPLDNQVKTTQSSMKEMETGKEAKSNAAQTNSTPNQSSNSVFNELDMKDLIVKFIQDVDQGDGVALTVIAEKFQTPKEKLKEILDDLCQDIQLYKSQPGHYSSY